MLAGAQAQRVGAGRAPVQRLLSFLSEATWDVRAVAARRRALLGASAAMALHGGGVLVPDDTGDRKDGTATDHVARRIEWRR